MIKVLIVDDEFLVRMGIKTIINWEELGFQIVGDAEDGKKALVKAKKVLPDVVLTDIIMPEMDGLELIKALKEELPQTKAVVLSCYQDFEYVREAMQYLGALDYVPKLSMQPQDLIDVMLNVKSVIEREQKEYKQRQDLEQQLNHNIHVVRGKWVNEQLKNNQVDKDSWLTRGEVLKLNWDCEQDYFVIGMYIYDNNRLDTGSNNASIVNPSIVNVLDGIIKRNRMVGNTFYIDYRFCIIVNMDLYEYNNSIERIKSLCRQFSNDLKLYFNISASFGISTKLDKLSQLKKGYHEAFEACKARFYEGESSILCSEDVLPFVEVWYFDGQMVRGLISALEEGTKSKTFLILDDYFQKLREDGRVLPDVVFEECSEILSIFSSVLKMYGASIYDISNRGYVEPYEAMSSCETLGELHNWYYWFMDAYFECFEKIKDNLYGREIAKAIEYIKRNYVKELRLGNVAEHIGMNESYLSHMFKKETGYTFTEFVNKRRIEKAKELFRTKDMNVQEISYAVGYTNVSYFSRIFKQIVGTTPNEYKKSKNIYEKPKNSAKK